MKKQLFWMIGAALALTSCSNDEQVAVNPVNEITFRTTVPMRTLASDIYSSTSLDQFTVNAWIVNKDNVAINHIQNEIYKKGESGESNVYTLSDGEPHYWSVDDKSIWGEAWASGYTEEDNVKVTTPSEASSGNTETYSYVVKVADVIDNQKDFITAPIGTSNVPDGIGLTFKHQLAKIGIKAKNDSEYKIEIKKGSTRKCPNRRR